MNPDTVPSGLVPENGRPVAPGPASGYGVQPADGVSRQSSARPEPSRTPPRVLVRNSWACEITPGSVGDADTVHSASRPGVL